MTVDLSVIVIARNEQRRIGACLESCVESIRLAREHLLIRTAEAFLVDSASTDETVKIARTFPVAIVELPPRWPLSAAAGRFVGMRHAAGDLILFVDGDYVLVPEWLSDAIQTLHRETSIGAVTGKDIEESTGDTVIMRYVKRSVEALDGEPEGAPVGLYRRTAIVAAGGLNPFLRGGEDRDLARRMRGVGYRIVRTPRTMGHHRWADQGSLDYITYFKSVVTWSVGDGQVLRSQLHLASVREQTRRRYVNMRYLQNYLVALLLATVVLANVASLITRYPWSAAMLDGVVAFVLAFLKHKRGWSWRELAFQFHVVPYSVFRHFGLALGFAQKPRDASEYPTGEHLIEASSHDS